MLIEIEIMDNGAIRLENWKFLSVEMKKRVIALLTTN